jgi:hypothetical protein
VSAWANGVYLVQVVDGKGERFTRKIVKN